MKKEPSNILTPILLQAQLKTVSKPRFKVEHKPKIMMNTVQGFHKKRKKDTEPEKENQKIIFNVQSNKNLIKMQFLRYKIQRR